MHGASFIVTSLTRSVSFLLCKHVTGHIWMGDDSCHPRAHYIPALPGARCRSCRLNMTACLCRGGRCVAQRMKQANCRGQFHIKNFDPPAVIAECIDRNGRVKTLPYTGLFDNFSSCVTGHIWMENDSRHPGAHYLPAWPWGTAAVSSTVTTVISSCPRSSPQASIARASSPPVLPRFPIQHCMASS